MRLAVQPMQRKQPKIRRPSSAVATVCTAAAAGLVSSEMRVICRGGGRAIRTPFGSARSCCSRPKWRPSSDTFRGSWRPFPRLRSLAAAEEDDVLRLWEGLGYYRRARQMHAAAKIIVAEHDGEFPRESEAVARFAWHRPLHRRRDLVDRLRCSAADSGSQHDSAAQPAGGVSRRYCSREHGAAIALANGRVAFAGTAAAAQ